MLRFLSHALLFLKINIIIITSFIMEKKLDRSKSWAVYKYISFTKEYAKEPWAECRCLKMWQRPNFKKKFHFFTRKTKLLSYLGKVLISMALILFTIGVLVSQSCPTLCNPMNHSPPGSSVHGILQARILEWVAISLSRGSARPRNRNWVSCIAVNSLPSEPPGKHHNTVGNDPHFG